jgi:sarcosine oxidase subunit delta
MPDPRACDDQQWSDYVFNRSGEPGVKTEWWYHVPSGTWFLAERDNQTDEFIRTWLYSPEAGNA